ncbi:glycosyltransferase family 4 protein [Zafaria sp. Z1313]|uniref:glycosyltransferase family 4 protein n=1 Tax=Zafaria sp. Z1313 TaxID=3423202 RepID=UPI003D30279A
MGPRLLRAQSFRVLKRLAGNLLMTVRTVVEHLSDDPVVLVLQGGRRFGHPALNSAVGSVAGFFRRDDSVCGAVLKVLAGDDASVAAALRRAAGFSPAPRRACRLADVAIAIGDVEAAERLLEAVPVGTPDASATRARLRWHMGDMTGALEALEGATGSAGTLRSRLGSELQVFRGARIQLEPRPGFVGRPRRVLHVLINSLPHTGSGYAQRSHSTLVALRDQGWDVLAATRVGYPVQVGRILAADRDTVDGIEYRRLLPWRLADGMEQRLQQQATILAGIVEEFRPSVLHTTTHFVNAAVVRAVAEAYGIPWVYEVRGQLADTWASTRPVEARGSERYRLFREREGDAVRSADAVVTLGAQMRDEVARQGVDRARITICPNAVGEAFLAEPQTAERARTALGLDPAGEYIGTVSSIVAYEGLDDLVAAFAVLARERPALRLLIVGDGEALPRLKLQARELGIADRCLFPGRVQRADAPLYHQALDVFVVPRKDLEVTRSVTPLKPVEASASGRPVVASALPALGELVDEGVTGRLFPAEDVQALARILGSLLDDAGARTALGTAGRSWALASRTWAANAERYATLYEALPAAVDGG